MLIRHIVEVSIIWNVKQAKHFHENPWVKAEFDDSDEDLLALAQERLQKSWAGPNGCG